MAILGAATAFKKITAARETWGKWGTRGTITARAAFLGTLFALATTLPLSAQSGGMKLVSKHGDWKVSCGTPVGSAKKMCGVSQTVTSEAKPNAGLTLAIFQRVNGQKIMRIRTPLGVLIPYGLLIKVDDAEFGRAPYLLCDMRGCLSEFPLKDAQLNKLLSGKEALFIFWFTPEEGIVFPIQVAGLKPALAKLK